MVSVDQKQLLAHELHRPARRNFPTRRTTLKGRNDLLQMDLVEMQQYKRFNDNYRYILTVINCFTKVAAAIPLKNKSGPTLATALESILKKHPNNKVKNVHTDRGTEFYNSHVQAVFKRHGINHYSTYSDKKAAIVERFNRTIKERMWVQFTAQGNYKWLKLLPKLITRYNNTFHRSIGMAPNKVNAKNEHIVAARLQPPLKRIPAKFEIDETVRISRSKGIFAKGYIGNWSQELFKVASINPSVPTTYTLKDLNDEPIMGSFYEQEMIKANVRDVFFVEKILKRIGDKALVRWKGYSSEFDSWIDLKKDLTTV
jgi:L-rhamnose mutarotase